MFKNFALALGFIFVSINSFADWVKTGGNDQVEHYVDTESVRRISNTKIRIWSLQNYTVTNNSGGRSIKALQEFDCSAETVTMMHAVISSGVMGSGDILLNQSVNKTNPIIPGSTDNTVFTLLCRGSNK